MDNGEFENTPFNFWYIRQRLKFVGNIMFPSYDVHELFISCDMDSCLKTFSSQQYNKEP